VKSHSYKSEYFSYGDRKPPQGHLIAVLYGESYVTTCVRDCECDSSFVRRVTHAHFEDFGECRYISVNRSFATKVYRHETSGDRSSWCSGWRGYFSAL
jgi:hypothetical protein